MLTYQYGMMALSFLGSIQALGNNVKITNNGPVVFGANITFTANLYSSDGTQPLGNFIYDWKDNLDPQNKAKVKDNATSTWTVRYSADKYRAGTHWVEVTVYEEHILIDWPICRKLESFTLTDFLNGDLTLWQSNVIRDKSYVSNTTEVLQTIELNAPDLEYIKQNHSSITTHWYIDCKLVGISSDFTFRHNYTEVGVTYNVYVFLIASNLTATNKTAGKGLKNNTSPDVLLNTITDSSNSTKFSYETLNNVINGNNLESEIPFDCATKNIKSERNHSVLGLFSRKFTVKAPISNITITGNQWLKHGDLLDLNITCQGSAPLEYCYWYTLGYYNVTGHERCDYPDVYETCNIHFRRYLENPIHYSIVLVLQNDLNKVVRSIGIDVYDVTKHPQLSVIVVPVSAAMVAVIFFIFGIAYYFQKRHTFTIEVADFDFSTNANGMEYKTFRERLVEAFHNAFDKTEEFYEQDNSNGVPAANSGRKYGSMQ